MIPRTIHCCWFGGGAKPQIALSCIGSWRKLMPEYEIVEWSEDNFDVGCNRYVREAYEARLYAFVTDYVRLYAIYNYGGIYMDTDVEVIRPLDEFLRLGAFTGFEDGENVPTGIIAGEMGCPAIRDLLEDYGGRRFIVPGGRFDTTTNVAAITGYFLRHGLVQDNSLQTVNGVTIYPREYFCPKNCRTIETKVSENTYAIHHFAGSWLPAWKRRRAEIRKKIRSFLAKKLGLGYFAKD
jgi:mannosyltransferase OCH1-like enzyme